MIPKPKKKKWSVSENYLDRIWSTVIREKYNHRCGLCNQPGQQSHHIIKRCKRVLRWHPLNGIYLCVKHHQEAHTAKGAIDIATNIGGETMAFLYSRERLTLKDFCTATGMTVDEFRQWSLDKLKEYLR